MCLVKRSVWRDTDWDGEDRVDGWRQSWEGMGKGLGAEGLNNGSHLGAGMHKWAHSSPWKIAVQAIRPRCSHMFYSTFSLLCPAPLPLWENMPS